MDWSTSCGVPGMAGMLLSNETLLALNSSRDIASLLGEIGALRPFRSKLSCVWSRMSSFTGLTDGVRARDGGGVGSRHGGISGTKLASFQTDPEGAWKEARLPGRRNSEAGVRTEALLSGRRNSETNSESFSKPGGCDEEPALVSFWRFKSNSVASSTIRSAHTSGVPALLKMSDGLIVCTMVSAPLRGELSSSSITSPLALCCVKYYILPADCARHLSPFARRLALTYSCSV